LIYKYYEVNGHPYHRRKQWDLIDPFALWGFSMFFHPYCPKSLGHFLTFATEAMVQSSRGRGSAWPCGAAGIASAEGGSIDEGAAITLVQLMVILAGLGRLVVGIPKGSPKLRGTLRIPNHQFTMS